MERLKREVKEALTTEQTGISGGVFAFESKPHAVGMCLKCRCLTGAVLYSAPSSATWHYCSCGACGIWVSEKDLKDPLTFIDY